MTKKDRMLALKFMSGNSRLNQGIRYSIDVSDNLDRFPIGHTCDATMDIPLYSSKEMME